MPCPRRPPSYRKRAASPSRCPRLPPIDVSPRPRSQSPAAALRIRHSRSAPPRAAHRRLSSRRGSALCPLQVSPSERACRRMIRRRALVELNASGGKASQAMTLLLAPIVSRDPLLVVHGPPCEVEWEDPGAQREHDSAGRAAHHGCRHLQKDPARTDRGTGDVALEIRQVVSVVHEAGTHRARATPRSEAPPRSQGRLINAFRIAAIRVPRSRPSQPMEAQRTHESRAARSLWRSAGLRPDGEECLPHHRQLRPVAPPDLLVPHLRIATGPAPRGRAVY